MTFTQKRALFWLVLGGGLLYFLTLIQPILMPFIMGFLIAYIFKPFVSWAESYGVPRWLASLLSTLLFFSVISLFLLMTIPFLRNKLIYLVENFPQHSEQVWFLVEPYALKLQAMGLIKADSSAQDALLSYFKDATAGGLDLALSLLSNLLSNGWAVATLISFLFIAPLVGFYLLKDWGRFTMSFWSFFPQEGREKLQELMERIDKTLGGYIRGQLLVCVILAIYYSLGLTWIARLDFAVVAGCLTGFLIFVPYVGFLTGLTLALTLALIQYTTWGALGSVLIVYGIGQALEGGLLTPFLIGKHTGLHPAWIIFGIFTGGVLFGFWGVVFSLPGVSVVGVLLRFLIERYKDSPFYKKQSVV